MTQLTLFKDPKSQEQMACSLLRTITGLSVEHCEQIVRRMGGVHKLAQAHESALAHQPGIGPKRAAKIKALTHWALLLQEVEVAEQVTTASAHCLLWVKTAVICPGIARSWA